MMKGKSKTKKELMIEVEELRARLRAIQSGEVDALGVEEVLASDRLSRIIFEQATDAVVVCDKQGIILRASLMAHLICGKNPLFQPFDIVFPLEFASNPDGRHEALSFFGMQKERNMTAREVRLTRQDGKVLYLRFSAGPLRDEADQVVATVVTLSDITERKQTEQALQKSKERFEILSETASRLLATDRPREIVNELCQKVMTYLDCHVFFNYLVDEDKQRLHLNACAGIPEETGQQVEWLDYGVAVCGCAARDASRIICEDIPMTLDPRTDLVKSFGIEAYACHPLFTAGRVIGTLSFGTRSRTIFSEDDLSLMKTVADQAASAMERIRLIEALKRSRDALEIKVNQRTAELAKANELLERMFSSIDMMVAYMDRDFNFIRVNRAYAEADGREPEFYIGKNHFGLFPNEENERIFREVVETGEPYSVFAKPFEYAEHPERGVTHWDWSLQPVKEPDGKVGGVVLSLVNVTERIQAQETIAAERQRFNDVLEVLPAYVVLLTPDYYVPFANRVFRERFGESRGKRCFEYLFGRNEPCEICETYTVLKTMSPHEWEWTGPDNRIYQVFDFPFTDTDGSTLILEMGIDITERKRTEETLKERESLLRTVFETLPLGVWIADREGRIVQGNPAGHKIWAGDGQGGIGQFGEYRGWRVDTGKQIKAEEWAVRRAVLRGETSINEEIEIECFDGTHKIILNSAVPIRNEKQEIIGAFVVDEDITDHKRAEKNLRQAQKMEALGTLVGGIAHDFNNILMPITINTELALLDTEEGNPTHQYLQPVLDAAKRGKDLVNQIITYSRQKEQERKPVKISPIIKEAIKFLRSSLPKSIEIRGSIETESDIIQADPTQIHQVLMNLSSNAAYAMREKGGILEVRLAPIEVDFDLVAKYPDLKTGPYVELTISDTGCGMPPDVIERIFDPFFTTKKPGEGTGLGLPVVLGVTKSHGGGIAVDSEIGRGSRFTIFFPRVQNGIEPDPILPGPIPTGKERILLIDDEKVQLQSVGHMLERFGYHVLARADSLEALDLFRANPDAFDLIITDQTMPQMTGEKLAESILRIRPDIPIILCTGFSEVVDADQAKTIGIREFVMKPFTIKEMTETIRKVLSSSISPLKTEKEQKGVKESDG
jgi:PAS domain S-box-containing protein